MRKVQQFWYDEKMQRLEVRFEDGGVSVEVGRQGAAISSEMLILALMATAENIRALEVNSPYPRRQYHPGPPSTKWDPEATPPKDPPGTVTERRP